MLLKTVFVFILSTFLHAIPSVNIDSNNTNINIFELEYFVDKTGKETLPDVLTQSFTPSMNNLSLGTGKSHLWLRFKIHNTSSSVQKIYIHQNHAYLSESLEFYELKNTLVLKSFLINFEDTTTKDDQEKMYSKDAIFTISLEKDETKIIYFKNYTQVLPYPYLTIHNENYSKKNLADTHNLLIIIIGILIALAIYNFTLYITTKHKEYLYYSLYLLNGIIWESIISGVLANSFGFYLTNITNYLLLSVLFIALFLILFAKKIFNTAQEYKKENKFLNLAIFIVSIDILIATFNITFAAYLTTFIYIYVFSTILLTSYSIMRKGNPYAQVFFLSNTFLSLFALITDLYYSGLIPYSEFVFAAASIGIAIESIILSYLISYRFKEQSISLKIKDKILFQQSKMVTMGEMVENIAHQWRQPLSHINSSVLLIDDYLFDTNKYDDTIEKELQSIENTTKYMSQTIDSFRNFFEENKTKNTFYLKNLFESSYLLLKNILEAHDIQINIDANENHQYTGLEDELQQVLLILFNNSIDILKERKSDSPCITISLTKQKQNYVLTISDNAGGINHEIIDKIFEPYFTTKHKAQGTGLGLYISKIIIEQNMQGHLSVYNNENGATFRIELPNK